MAFRIAWTMASDRSHPNRGWLTFGRLFAFWSRRMDQATAAQPSPPPSARGSRDRAALPERTRLAIGFIPLTDAAPLIVADRLGLFAAEGLEVSLRREPSWANIRDKVTVGAYDAGHMLAPMPLASTLGLGGIAKPMRTGLSLGLNGNAITLSTQLFERLCRVDPAGAAAIPMTAAPLKALLAEDPTPLTFAVVFPFSSHAYLLRYWLASAGIDPDRDVRLIVVPPPQMAMTLAAGRVDGFCVGAPWNSVAVAEGVGRIAIAGSEIWPACPEKVLGVTADWADRYPETHLALIRAVLRAQAWIEEGANRDHLVELLADPDAVGVDPRLLRPALDGALPFQQGAAPRAVPGYHRFASSLAGFPWISQARWLLDQMARWGQIDPTLDRDGVARAVYRPDLYRVAAMALGLPAPTIDTKPEGQHAEPWLLADASRPIPMEADRFFDRPAARDAA